MITPIQKLRRDEFEATKVGIYEVDEPHTNGTVYDGAYNEMFTGEIRTVVCFDQGKTELPSGVEEAYVRSDGVRVIVGKMPVRE